ncbi:glycosyltransferase family protein [Natronoflexus pectinivorans]|uniref:Glycosyltransferase n=1 Tax=Natronoflexus pectinivorans TaxID=682526 RepID=A0A4R2GNM5_9BACT|nr:glycosyltransferase [Natronoflexus pectinivorans]TCO10924.1 hypothetical protein EV194_101558 [Natronoflexus pectinivorans]
MNNVICIKWGTKFDPEYINRLYSMVKRNLTLDFRFVCLTDDGNGIDPAIEVKDIPQTGISDFDERKPWVFGHGWLKVASFVEKLHDLEGPTLFLDLDVVIVDNIDCLFQEEGEFLVIKEWDKKDVTGNTSVYRFNAGTHSDALEYLNNNMKKVLSSVRNEQEFITGYMASQGKIKYWPAEWCVSFKRHCLPKPLGWFGTAEIPENSKVIVFHGKPNPPEAIKGISGKWYRRVAPVKWIEEYWK